MVRWMVTGASGLLGANLALETIARGHPTTACYGSHELALNGAECLPLPLTDPAAVREVIASQRPRIIVHCAAETRVDYCEDHPDVADAVNVRGTRAVAESAAHVGAKLVYVSTDSIFEGGTGRYSEDDEPTPQNVYALTKLAGEQMVRRETANHLIVRTNLFGWSAQPTLSLAEWILDRLERGLTVPGFTDVVFSPVLVNHLAEIIFEAVARDLRGTYHVSASSTVTKYTFAQMVGKSFGFDPAQVIPASSADAGFRARRPLNTSLSSDRIVSALGRNMPSVEDGILLFRRLRDAGHKSKLRAALRAQA